MILVLRKKQKPDTFAEKLLDSFCPSSDHDLFVDECLPIDHKNKTNKNQFLYTLRKE